MNIFNDYFQLSTTHISHSRTYTYIKTMNMFQASSLTTATNFIYLSLFYSQLFDDTPI